MKNKIIKIVCFITIFAVLFFRFEKVFNFKYGDGIYSLSCFYEEPEDSIDVLCFGSSHIFENVNTGILWKEYGIADFNLCGSIQPVWNTYYYMKEALKTQRPRVMVVDVYGTIQTEDYIDHSRIIKNNYGLKFSKDKIESILVSSPEESRIDYLMEHSNYHNRYSEITRSDFADHLGMTNYKNWKGFGLNTAVKAFSEPKEFDTNETAELTDKVTEYLMKIIELSKEKDIPLLLIKTPYCGVTLDIQKKYNKVAEIAGENDIPFINFNRHYKEIGINFETDFADANHMNHRGNVKFTRYLAGYLKENYEIPDRRGDSAYGSYDFMADNCEQRIYNLELTQINQIDDYLEKIRGGNYTAVYSITGDYKDILNYDEVRSKLQTVGINLDEADGDTVWVVRENNILFSGSGSIDFEWHTQFGENNNLMVTSSDKSENKIEINLSNTHKYIPVEDGFHIFLYDNCTETFVGAARFPIINDYLSDKR